MSNKYKNDQDSMIIALRIAQRNNHNNIPLNPLLVLYTGFLEKEGVSLQELIHNIFDNVEMRFPSAYDLVKNPLEGLAPFNEFLDFCLSKVLNTWYGYWMGLERSFSAGILR